VPPGNEQDMLRRLWIDILERDDILVLIDNLTWYLTGCNFAEQAVLNAHTSPSFLGTLSNMVCLALYHTGQ